VTVRAALVGCGPWGKNLLRVLLQSARARLAAIVDAQPARRADAELLAPGVPVFASLTDALAAGVDAVLVATPPHPHAALVLAALDPGPIRVISAREAEGGDPVRIEAQLPTGLEASMLLSRSSASKERRMRLTGSLASASFDDVRAPDRVIVTGPGEAREIRVPWREPLAVEVDHFLRCVEERARPRTPIEEGVTVVRALAAAEQACGLAAADHALPLI
jgi:predicted dehydrogenase